MDSVEIGRGATLRNTSPDKNLKVPPGARIGVDREIDAIRFQVSPKGAVAIAKETGVALE